MAEDLIATKKVGSLPPIKWDDSEMTGQEKQSREVGLR
jgi:hypothetical protein